MLVRPREVATVLLLVLTLVAAKYTQLAELMPLTSIIGVICFTFAIYLSLRIYNAELARIRSE